MTVAECVKILLTSQGLTQRELAERIEYAGQGAITTALSRDDGIGMRVKTLIRYLEAMDAQLLVVSLNDDEELVLDGESEL